jgi:hypothetical protein
LECTSERNFCMLLKVTAFDLAVSFKLMLSRFVVVTASSQAKDRRQPPDLILVTDLIKLVQCMCLNIH